jgi:hypothetical protein
MRVLVGKQRLNAFFSDPFKPVDLIVFQNPYLPFLIGFSENNCETS